MNRHIEEAKRWLGYLRQGVTSPAIFLDYFHEQVNMGSFSLYDIGTSEEELEYVRVMGCKAAALNWLNHLRQGDRCEMFLGYLREEIHKGGLLLSDIDTNEEELASLGNLVSV